MVAPHVLRHEGRRIGYFGVITTAPNVATVRSMLSSRKPAWRAWAYSSRSNGSPWLCRNSQATRNGSSESATAADRLRTPDRLGAEAGLRFFPDAMEAEFPNGGLGKPHTLGICNNRASRRIELWRIGKHGAAHPLVAPRHTDGCVMNPCRCVYRPTPGGSLVFSAAAPKPTHPNPSAPTAFPHRG